MFLNEEIERERTGNEEEGGNLSRNSSENRSFINVNEEGNLFPLIAI